MGTSTASLSATYLALLWPLLVTAMRGTSAGVGKEQGLQTKLGSVFWSSDDG